MGIRSDSYRKCLPSRITQTTRT